MMYFNPLTSKNSGTPLFADQPQIIPLAVPQEDPSVEMNYPAVPDAAIIV